VNLEEPQNQDDADRLTNEVILMVLSRVESPGLAVLVLANAVARLARDNRRDVNWLTEVVGTAYDLVEPQQPSRHAN
jgi:hypothetical protein